MRAYGAGHFDATRRKCKVVKSTRARERRAEANLVAEGLCEADRWLWWTEDWYDDVPGQEAEMWALHRG